VKASEESSSVHSLSLVFFWSFNCRLWNVAYSNQSLCVRETPRLVVTLSSNICCYSRQIFTNVNVKLALCLIKHHVMKMYAGAEVQLYEFLTVTGQLYAPTALPCGNRSHYPLDRWSESQNPSRRVGEGTNLCPCWDSNPSPRIAQPVAWPLYWLALPQTWRKRAVEPSSGVEPRVS
jgi:hypothetical protein